jgi:hypothetical protein
MNSAFRLGSGAKCLVGFIDGTGQTIQRPAPLKRRRLMKKFIIATALLAMGATSFTAPAQAAPLRAETALTTTLDVTKAHSSNRRHWHKRPHRARILNPRQVVRKLRHRGFRNIRNIRYNHGRYYAVARGRYGPVRLTVSAKTGQVITRERIRKHRRNNEYRHGYRGQRNGFSFTYTFR